MSLSAAARFRYTLVAGATAVVIGSGFTVVGLSRQADAQAGSANANANPAGLSAAVANPSTAAGPSAAVPLPPAPATTPPKPKPTSKSPSPKATTATHRPKVSTQPIDDSVLGQVLAHINAARTAAGLAPLTLDTKLSKASALHNQLMINGCGLEHQCPGESGIGDRFSAQGVQWTSAGENIGFGSSGSSDADIIKAANGLTDSMLAEKPPNDGHRKNLLNTGYQKIGLSVVRDSKGITWMTQDFVN